MKYVVARKVVDNCVIHHNIIVMFVNRIKSSVNVVVCHSVGSRTSSLASTLAYLPCHHMLKSLTRQGFFFWSIQPKIGTRHLLGSKGGQSDPYRLWPSLLSGQVLGSKDMISITWPTKHQLIYNNKVLAPYTNWRQLAKRSHLGFFFACQGKRFQLRAGGFGKLATFCGTLHSSATCSEINGNIQNILIAKNVANRQHKPGLIATFWSGYVTTFKPYTQ